MGIRNVKGRKEREAEAEAMKKERRIRRSREICEIIMEIKIGRISYNNLSNF